MRLAGPQEVKALFRPAVRRIARSTANARTPSGNEYAEIAVNRETLRVVQRMREQAETARRKAKESLETSADANARARLAEQYERAKLNSELFSQIVTLRRAEEVNTRLSVEIGQCAEFLKEKLEVISKDVVFSNQHLQTVLDELDKFEENLRTQLTRNSESFARSGTAQSGIHKGWGRRIKERVVADGNARRMANNARIVSDAASPDPTTP